MSPSRSPRREVQVGIFVVAGVLAVVVALFMLTDPGMLRGRYTVTTLVDDAGGIRKRDAVQLRGVNIGRITDLELTRDGRVRMRLELNGDYPFPDDSRVQITEQGLLGEKVAQIVEGESTRMASRGDVLPSGPAAGGLGATAETLGVKADTILGRAQELLSHQTIGAVGASAQELQAVLTELTLLAGEQRRQLSGLTASLRRSAEGVEGAATRPELARAIARTDSLTIKLDAATASLTRAGNSLAVVVGRIERGEGTLGRLTTDDALYDNLNVAVTNLAQLTEAIKNDPKRYLSVSVF